MPQTATTGNLAQAQRVTIAATRFTEEHNTPAMQAIEMMRLENGAKQVTVPKVGQMTMVDLVDGQDIVDEEEIGMTTVDLTSAEVGGKVVLTDKLVRQSQPSVFSIVGRQMGDGMARKEDTDVIALYSGLNGGTTFGGNEAKLNASNYSGAIASAKGKQINPFNPTYAIHHPSAVYDYVRSTTAIGSNNVWPEDMNRSRMEKFWSQRSFNGVALFEDGNIVSGIASIGVMAQKDALVVLRSVATRTERQRDASLRGTELVMTSDYGVFELDDTKGAPMTYDSRPPTTSATV